MTDGAARTLLASGNQALIDRAVPHLTSRDAGRFWTSGQWMTEATGGSDVGLSLTRAEHRDGTWRLYGKKWFTSAATSQMALTLARPEGNGPGGSGLALFYLETRDAHGQLNGIRVERLKDKLGTRKVPTAELTLDGAVAHLVAGATHGTRSIEPMLRVTRTWNSVCAASFLRHGLGLAEDYATRRLAFGARLADQPLHRATLDDVDAESAGAFLLAFALAELLGRDEGGELDAGEAALLRLLTPLAKATTGKQAAAGRQRARRGLRRRRLRGGHRHPRAAPRRRRCCRSGRAPPTCWPWTCCCARTWTRAWRRSASGSPGLRPRRGRPMRTCGSAGAASLAAIDRAIDWHRATRDPGARQRAARRFILTLGRALELALLAEHAASLAGDADGPAARRACLCFQRPRRRPAAGLTAMGDSMRDNVVVITGASKGIGAELARQLAARGARLALAARDSAALDAVAAECRRARRRGGGAADRRRRRERLPAAHRVDRRALWPARHPGQQRRRHHVGPRRRDPRPRHAGAGSCRSTTWARSTAPPMRCRT